MSKHVSKAGGVRDHKIAVSLLHQVSGQRSSHRRARIQQSLHTLNHRRLNRQRMHCSVRQAADHLRALSNTAEIAYPVQAESRQDGLILGGEASQVIRAKQPTPPNDMTIPRGIAAQITKIGGPCKRQMPGQR